MRGTLLQNKQAVAGVIEALLLVALVATIISTIQLVYIPELMEQRELEHMDEVSNQFSHLKSLIDIQVATQSDAPVSSIITLGSRELPYFLTVPSQGELSVINSDDYYIEIDGVSTITTLSSISYYGDNSYFYKQTWALEGGGIIIHQREPTPSSAMRVNPTLNYTEDGSITIHFALPTFLSFSGKESTAHRGKAVVRTNYSNTEGPITYPVTNFFRVYTRFTEAWNHTFSDLLGDKLDVSKTDEYVEIRKISDPFDLEITYIRIYAQIGPGWIIESIN
jgi:hypothetical protein